MEAFGGVFVFWEGIECPMSNWLPSGDVCRVLARVEPLSIEAKQAPDSLASSLGISAQVDKCMHNFRPLYGSTLQRRSGRPTDLQLVDLQRLGTNFCLR